MRNKNIGTKFLKDYMARRMVSLHIQFYSLPKTAVENAIVFKNRHY